MFTVEQRYQQARYYVLTKSAINKKKPRVSEVPVRTSVVLGRVRPFRPSPQPSLGYGA